MQAHIIAFPIERIVWRAIEVELRAEIDRSRNIARGYIRVFPTNANRERIDRELSHIPRDVLSEAMQRLRPRIKDAVALANAELYEAVFCRRLRK